MSFEFNEVEVSFHDSELNFFGILIKEGDEYSLFRELDDFKISDLVLYPTSLIKSINKTLYTEFRTKILYSENRLNIEVLQSDRTNTPLNLKSLFKHLKTLGRAVSIENQDNYSIGNIVDVQDNQICLQTISADGEVSNETLEVEFNELIKITIDSDYNDLYQKYQIK
jgi:hypothetical protein